MPHIFSVMDDKKKIQVQFRLVDIKQLQFVTLTNEWPQGELQITNQLQFSSETDKRFVRCTAQFEYKRNDVTQLIISVQSVFEFAREGWSAMYNLQGDEWIIPSGLVQHMADITIGATRGMLALRSEENGFPRIVLPMMLVSQFIRENLRLKRNPQNPPIPLSLENT